MIINNHIKFLRSLSTKQARNESQIFVAEGDKLISELLESSILEVEHIYLTEDSKLLVNENVNSEIIDFEIMERISQMKSPAASLALVKIPRNDDVTPPSDKLSIVLDGVQDPGNLGTIIRIADWYGIKNIFCSPTCADCFSPKVIQSTMGAIGRVLVTYTDLAPMLQNFEGNIWGTIVDENASTLYDVEENLNQGILVMGNEGRGISDEIAELLTKQIYIPHFGDANHVESLNVAVATAITVAEIRRKG